MKATLRNCCKFRSSSISSSKFHRSVKYLQPVVTHSNAVSLTQVHSCSFSSAASSSSMMKSHSSSEFAESEDRSHSATEWTRLACASFDLQSADYCAGYNPSIYEKMRDDQARTTAYRRAIEKHCRHRTVLDIGTGALALLSVFSAESGAKHTYALEVNPEAFEQASKTVSELGLSEKITVIQGLSTDEETVAHFKERSVDLIVHEIIGELASSEGVCRVFNHAIKHYAHQKTQDMDLISDDEHKSDEDIKQSQNSIVSIPHRARTYLTLVEWPSPDYWRSLPDKVILPPDWKSMNLFHFLHSSLICGENMDQWCQFEDICFNQGGLIPERFEMKRVPFVAQRDGVIAGVLTCIGLDCDASDEADDDESDAPQLSSHPVSGNTHWPNKYIDLKTTITVNKGDTLFLSAQSDVSGVSCQYTFTVEKKTEKSTLVERVSDQTITDPS